MRYPEISFLLPGSGPRAMELLNSSMELLPIQLHLLAHLKIAFSSRRGKKREKWQMAKTETCHFITILSNNLLLSSMSEFFYKEIFLKKIFHVLL
jgi:hypothetical protein